MRKIKSSSISTVLLLNIHYDTLERQFKALSKSTGKFSLRGKKFKNLCLTAVRPCSLFNLCYDSILVI